MTTLNKENLIKNMAEAMYAEDSAARWKVYDVTGIYPQALHRENYMGMARAALAALETAKGEDDE